jgi:TonB-linked SusC/RagA family outer membrane protein
MGKFRLIFFLILWIPCHIHAQNNVVIKGKVTERKTGESIPGVTVIEVNEDNRNLNGTVTDANGNFTIKVSDAYGILKISCVGFVTEEINIGGSKFFNIELEEETLLIDEITITAEGKKIGGLNPVTERDLTSSIESIEMKELEEIKVSSIGEVLQGRASNVDITLASGDPGAGLSIRVRGTASISGSNEPLIVVDGVPFETVIDDDFDNLGEDFDFTGATQEQFSGLLNIAPEDIVSIQVLKDAAATAVWGSRGANGVILINTKRGKKGKATFEYLYKLSVNQQPESVPLLNGWDYSMLQLEEIFNSGSTEIPIELAYDKEYEDYFNYAQNTDWLKSVTQTGYTHDHNFSMIGGGESALYRFSVGYLDQEGTTIGTNYKRLTSRFNLDYNVSTRLLFSGDLSYSYGDKDLSYPGTVTREDEDENWNTIRAVAYVKAPNMSLYEYDIDGNLTNLYFTPEDNFQGQGYEWFNPYAMVNEAVYNRKTHRLRTKLQLKYNITNSLVFQSFVAYDVDNALDKQFLPQTATGTHWTSTFVNRSSGMDYQVSSLETQSQIVYSYAKGMTHKLTSMLAFTLTDKKNGWYYGSTSNTPSSFLQNYTEPAPVFWIGDGYSQNRMVAFLGFVHYSLFDRYLVQFNIRREGSSRFGYNSRWGTFPSVSLAYRISSEPFMQNISFINNLKLRYSYGVNGNQPGGSYTYFNRYTTYGEYIDLPVVLPINIQLDNFRWEKNSQIDFGFDFFGFKERLEVHFDVYKQQSKDLIWEDLKLPGTSGFPEITRNWGTMDNNGWEFVINYDIIKSQNVTLNFNFNIANNINTITSIPENFDFVYGSEARNGQYARRAQVGDPIGTFYGFKFKGVYPTDADAVAYDADGNVLYDLGGNPIYMRYGNADGYRFRGGDAIYEDINHDGLINELDIVKIGDSNPDYFGGFGPKLTWKNLIFNFFFHYRIGHDIVNRTKMLNENMYNRNNQSVAALNRWRRQGDITDVPRALYDQGYNWLGSDRFVEDGSFVRFKSASVSYNFKDLFKKLQFKDLKLHFMIYNLYTWTNYTGVDPEVPMLSDDPFFIGEDDADTPPPKNFIVSLHMRF